MFWSGQSFEESLLKADGNFNAASARFTEVTQVDKKALRRWLVQAIEIQWDYKNIVKRRGRLVRLK